MIRKRVLALLLALPSVCGCRETPRAKAAELNRLVQTRRSEFAKRLAAANADPQKDEPIAQWLMPPQLREISGLVLTSRGTVLAHDDNAAYGGLLVLAVVCVAGRCCVCDRLCCVDDLHSGRAVA